MENKKLRIGFVSNCPIGGKTGLGRNMKAILPELYNTNKYEIFFLAQGMQDNDPNFQRLPFKCEGVFKNFDQNRFNNPNEEGYRRIVAYGNTAIENFVINNKLDCLILSDDAWAFLNEFYLNTEWFQHIKQNILPIITADSEPLLPQIKEWAEKCPNMRFWSKFAGRVLKKENPEKYKDCSVIYGALDVNTFKPLPKNERLELRRKFGIADDEKIVIYLGRNQLRKIYAANIEGLAKFKKRNPNKKVRLLFHCSWSEPGGWPLNQIREQNGLNKEDILTTYYCRNCGDWNVQPYENEDIDCKHCNAQRSRITAGIGSTINEEDLNKIYNLCDGSSSCFTSGSFEFTNPESMLAGLPLAVPNYVCGEDFIDSGYVYEIKGTYTWESNTGFKKFVPDTNSISDFLEYIYNLPEDKRKKLIEGARKWAIEQFDAKNISKIYETFLDSCKPINWEEYLNRKKDIKPINAPVQDHPDDIMFIKNAYKTILNMDVKDDDSGLAHWKSFLSQNRDKGQLKNEMIQAFRNAGVIHNQKVLPPVTIESLLENNGKKNFLLVCPESAGDCLYVSATLKSFRQSYPEDKWNIYLATKPEFAELFDLNPHITKLLPYQPIMDNEINMLGSNNKGPFQGFCFITALSQRFLSYLGNHNISLQLS